MRVGVDEHAHGATLLGEVDLDAAEVGAIAHQNDLAVQVDVLGGEMVEVLQAAVVGVNHLGGHVAGAGGAAEGHHHAGIVLIRVAINVFARGAAHQQLAAGVISLHTHSFWLIHQHAIGNDLRLQAGRAKLLRHVFGGLAVFGG